MNPKYSVNNGGDDWMSKVNQIKEARKVLSQNAGLMSAWERQTISEDINDNVSRNYSRIYGGAKERLDNAKNTYKSATAKRQAAEAREINSWDTGKLNAEMQAYQTRVNIELAKQGAGIFGNGPTISKRIEALYREAVASGDKHKIRAAAEAVQAANTDKLPIDQRVEVQSIRREANDKLNELRFTDDIATALNEENAAILQLQNEQKFVREVGAVLNDDQEFLGMPVGSFAKLASTVRFVEDGVKLLELDDPEITGIRWSTDPGTMEQLQKDGNND